MPYVFREHTQMQLKLTALCLLSQLVAVIKLLHLKIHASHAQDYRNQTLQELNAQTYQSVLQCGVMLMRSLMTLALV